MAQAARELETERLRLRIFRDDDFPVYETWCADINVMRYLGGKTYNRIEAWRHMAFLVGHWELRGYGHYALEDKATGELVGRSGFMDPTGWPGFELGWTIAPAHQGRGLATEVAKRLMRYAFEDLGRPSFISLIHPDNTPSRRVAEKLGETISGESVILGMPVLIYGIENPAQARGE